MHAFSYMNWAKTYPPVKFNLARSGVKELRLADLSPDLKHLDITGMNVYGYEKLLQAIAERFEVGTNQIVLAQGTSFANHLVYAGLLQPGDEAIVEQPAYEVLYKLPCLFHAQVKRLLRRYENGFQIDPDDLKRMMSDRVRLIVLTDLHNPSGVKLDRDILIQIGEIAALHGAHVLVDEVYLESYYEHRPTVAAKLGDAFITTSSLTKAYGLGGLRCGWIICQPDMANRLRLLNDFFGAVGVFISEQIDAFVLQKIESLASAHQEYLGKNYLEAVRFMNGHASLEWVCPDGGMIAFPKIKGNIDSQKLAQTLREKFSTSIVPGHFFEMPQHFRFAWGLDTDALKQGLKNLDEALVKLQQ